MIICLLLQCLVQYNLFTNSCLFSLYQYMYRLHICRYIYDIYIEKKSLSLRIQKLDSRKELIYIFVAYFFSLLIQTMNIIHFLHQKVRCLLFFFFFYFENDCCIKPFSLDVFLILRCFRYLQCFYLYAVSLKIRG